jgi:hypothetical protein
MRRLIKGDPMTPSESEKQGQMRRTSVALRFPTAILSTNFSNPSAGWTPDSAPAYFGASNGAGAASAARLAVHDPHSHL